MIISTQVYQVQFANDTQFSDPISCSRGSPFDKYFLGEKKDAFDEFDTRKKIKKLFLFFLEAVVSTDIIHLLKTYHLERCIQIMYLDLQIPKEIPLGSLADL